MCWGTRHGDRAETLGTLLLLPCSSVTSHGHSPHRTGVFTAANETNQAKHPYGVGPLSPWRQALGQVASWRTCCCFTYRELESIISGFLQILQIPSKE